MRVMSLYTWLVRTAALAMLAVALAVASLAGLRLARWQVTAEVYRERLQELSGQYERLRHTYNQAVRKTAVTELLVEDGRVWVTVRTAAGVVETIPTPYAASDEIYVDYVVLDGRLWIRRVFDEHTPPGRGVAVSPALVDVDWDAPGAAHGKAVYRRLSEGRWVVSVTGDGALGLAKVEAGRGVDLASPPEVRDYAEVVEEAQAQVQEVGPGDVLRGLIGG